MVDVEKRLNDLEAQVKLNTKIIDSLSNLPAVAELATEGIENAIRIMERVQKAATLGIEDLDRQQEYLKKQLEALKSFAASIANLKK